MIRLGGHGVIADPEGDPDELAAAHVAFGYAAAYCPPVAVTDTDRLRAIERAFARSDVSIAEIGIWRNVTALEPEARAANLRRAIDCLAIADEVGAGCAVTYIGTFSPRSDYAPHPMNLGQDAFDLAVATCRTIIDEVKPKRAKFALEMMQYALPDSPDVYLDLIRAVDREAFGAHFDPVNLVMTPRVYFENGKLITEMFEKLGAYVVSCHAKDIVLHHQAALHLDEVMIGEGALDYAVYLKQLDRLGREVPLMLEHYRQWEYAHARDEVYKIGDAVGVGFFNRPPAG